MHLIPRAEVESASLRTLSELLQGRVPGVMVQPSSGTLGTSSRIRIRGVPGVRIRTPLLIVDGTRVDGDPATFPFDIGGQQTSRFDDLNPEEIERVEVLSAVAAAALYGPAAAEGVVRVITRQGGRGPLRLQAFAERGITREVTDFPTNYRAVAPGAPPVIRHHCDLQLQAQGICTPTALLSFNPLVEASPFRTGLLSRYGASAAGGGPGGTFFLSGSYLREEGVVPVNERERLHLRANAAARVGPGVELQLSLGHLSGTLRLPHSDNSRYGYLWSGLMGDAVDDPVTRGYWWLAPPGENLFRIDTGQEVDRFTGGLGAGWAPLPWLRVEGRVGLDRIRQRDQQLYPAGLPLFPGGPAGPSFRESGSLRSELQTLWLGVTAERDLGGALRWRSSLAAEQISDSSALELRASIEEGEPVAFEERWLRSRLRGVLLRQELVWRDRVTASALVRRDGPEFYGEGADARLSHAFSLRWSVLPEPEDAGGAAGWLGSLQLHASLGTIAQVADDPLFLLAPLPPSGEPVSPGRVRELEVGAGGTGLGERLRAGIAAYQREADFLILTPGPPSGGFPVPQLALAGMRNQGVEGSLELRLGETRQVRSELRVVGAWNRNRVARFPEHVPLLGVQGVPQLVRPDHPVAAYFSRRILAWEDHNRDGIIAVWGCPLGPYGSPGCEVQLSPEPEYLGTAIPTRHLSLSGTTALGSLVRLSVLLDHQGGHRLFNATRHHRCGRTPQWQTCRELHDRSTPLEEQAPLAAGLLGSLEGYLERADFVKLREVALTLTLPPQWMGRVGVELTLAGRDLATWTGYSGFDPEVNFAGPDPVRTADLFTQPPLPYWTARLGVRF